ncbi:hypothetical protein ACCUM_0314 [Candidatus Accumulibacter phosphatis]|uniref:Uncharacterized protein n=1 Tax=Candidatus Accumulibacter phosphatis TaxID=327160 RepID=A0A5S4EKT3_9PROT|nr:hypothetical protein ACCUM_0314 [Candidatus Accumulibacter phosphatis]
MVEELDLGVPDLVIKHLAIPDRLNEGELWQHDQFGSPRARMGAKGIPHRLDLKAFVRKLADGNAQWGLL